MIAKLKQIKGKRMIIDEISRTNPILKDKIKRIENYYNLVKNTKVECIRNYYKQLLKENIVMLTKEGLVVDLQTMNVLVDSLN